MKAWMETFIGRVRQAFGERVFFVGLQGSRARDEAKPESDIDVVVILDRLTAEDVQTYRAALEGLKEREKICGFLAGRAELAAWDRRDLFQFFHDTQAYFGDLKALTPELTAEDARGAVRTGVCNIYHGCVHNLLFAREPDVLKGLYKAAGFVLRTKHFCEAGVYLRATAELAAALPERERRLLRNRPRVEALIADGDAFVAFSEDLFNWAADVIRAYGQ